MRNRTKLLIAAIAATALVGLAASAASARRLEVTNWERGFRIVWAHLHLEFAGREMDCPVTLEGTFEMRTYAKNSEELNQIGRVTAAAAGTAGTCAKNAMTILRATLPWEITYQSFSGTLPNITGVTLNFIRFSFNLDLEGLACLARTTTSRPYRGIAIVSGGTVTGFEAERNAGIETGGGFFCSLSGAAHFSGAASTTTVRGGAEQITIRLI